MGSCSASFISSFVRDSFGSSVMKKYPSQRGPHVALIALARAAKFFGVVKIKQQIGVVRLIWGSCWVWREAVGTLTYCLEEIEEPVNRNIRAMALTMITPTHKFRFVNAEDIMVILASVVTTIDSGKGRKSTTREKTTWSIVTSKKMTYTRATRCETTARL